MAVPANVITEARKVRTRQLELEEEPSYERAVRLQQAKFQHRLVRNETIKLIEDQ